jgi:hypothetical protein
MEAEGMLPLLRTTHSTLSSSTTRKMFNIRQEIPEVEDFLSETKLLRGLDMALFDQIQTSVLCCSSRDTMSKCLHTREMFPNKMPSSMDTSNNTSPSTRKCLQCRIQLISLSINKADEVAVGHHGTLGGDKEKGISMFFYVHISSIRCILNITPSKLYALTMKFWDL